MREIQVNNCTYISCELNLINTPLSVADNAEDAVFGRILNNPQHVLQAYLD